MGDVAEEQRADLVSDLAETQVSTVRGYAEPPQTISFGRCSFASASTSS